MTKRTKPCCAAAAAAQVQFLMVNGDRIGITNLDEILNKAKTVASEGEMALRGELLRLAKMYNYIPSQAEMAYTDALYSEYLKKGGTHQ